MNEARVAVHAPALKELKLQVSASRYFWGAEPTSSDVPLEKVLTRCRAAIQKVACDDSYNMKPDTRTVSNASAAKHSRRQPSPALLCLARALFVPHVETSDLF